MEQPGYYKATMVFGNGANCQSIRPAKDARTALAKFLQSPDISKCRQRHTHVDFDVVEMDNLPDPPEDRFWIERRDDGKYVVIDEKRKRALTFEFGRLQEKGRCADFHGGKPLLGVTNTDFLMEAHFWRWKHHPALVGE